MNPLRSLRFAITAAFALVAMPALLVASPAAACPMCHGSKSDKKAHAQAAPTTVNAASPGAAAKAGDGPRVLHVATLAIEGMTCGGCSKGLERTLARQPGVTEAKVSFKSKSAAVTFDPKLSNAQKLAAVISKDDQYTATVEEGTLAATTSIHVEGMTCGGCAKNVKTALAKLKGFRSAAVDVKAKRATVIFDPKTCSPEKVRGAITAAGYEASWPTGGPRKGETNGKEARVTESPPKKQG